jgi:hypothetical protein
LSADNETPKSVQLLPQNLSDLLQPRDSIFPAQNYTGKSLKRVFLHPPVPVPQLLESILEVANDTAPKRARYPARQYCCKHAVAVPIQHGCSF